MARLLAGVRGQPPADLDAVAAAITGLSQLAAELGGVLEAVDINPLICGPAGAVAVDALVIPRQPARPAYPRSLRRRGTPPTARHWSRVAAVCLTAAGGYPAGRDAALAGPRLASPARRADRRGDPHRMGTRARDTPRTGAAGVDDLLERGRRLRLRAPPPGLRASTPQTRLV